MPNLTEEEQRLVDEANAGNLAMISVMTGQNRMDMEVDLRTRAMREELDTLERRHESLMARVRTTEKVAPTTPTTTTGAK
jgi:hypothetical protein